MQATFRIDGSGIAQVRSHAKCHKKEFSTQRTFVTQNGESVLSPKQKITLSPEDQVVNAEILQALQFADCNYSFASAKTDADRFRKMFPDSMIAKCYQQSATKVKYAIQYGIAPYVKEKLIYDVRNKPFTFKFDETTNREVKKQYDGYLQYWSGTHNEIINAYCGSLFVGHCNSDQLVEHFNEFVENLSLDCKFLLHIGMDGPNVNLSFEQKLMLQLEELYGTSMLKLGSCSLHPVHTAFRKGILELSFNLDSFFHDIHFFFQVIQC